jgi:hypothetical protein
VHEQQVLFLLKIFPLKDNHITMKFKNKTYAILKEESNVLTEKRYGYVLQKKKKMFGFDTGSTNVINLGNKYRYTSNVAVFYNRV